MNFVILDLEWNGSYSRKKKGYINEIIEFGAVKCDQNLKVIDSFSCFVRPQVAKRLNTVIKNLTSIQDENLTDGFLFMQAVRKFKRFVGDALVLTWGLSDVLALIENCLYFSGNASVPFLTTYCDLQAYTESLLRKNSTEQMGLRLAAELLELDETGIEHHRALDDSRLTYEIFRKVYDKEKFQPFIYECNKEFYNRITFKTSYICDLASPLVKKKYMRFACPNCGGAVAQNTPWRLRNKNFRAEFCCKNCKYSFAGRVVIKQKYEGVSVNKKTFPLPIIEKPREAVSGKIGNMQLRIAENGVGLLRFPAFENMPEIAHAFSTRIGGVSKDEFSSMNLGFNRGDPQENVEENYKIFAQALKIPAENMTAGMQDHNINIRQVGKAEAGIAIWKPRDMESIDGLCTNEPNIPLVVYAADCVPLYYVDRKNKAIGLAHAGWKGTAAGMAKAMVQKMQEAFGSKPEDLIVGIGPSIGKGCFEVDLPVAEVFQVLPNSDLFVEDKQTGKYLVDLWECNKQFLLNSDIPLKNIFVGAVCSMCNSDLVFSHRKTRGHRGSNVAVLCLRDENDNEKL